MLWRDTPDIRAFIINNEITIKARTVRMLLMKHIHTSKFTFLFHHRLTSKYTDEVNLHMNRCCGITSFASSKCPRCWSPILNKELSTSTVRVSISVKHPAHESYDQTESHSDDTQKFAIFLWMMCLNSWCWSFRFAARMCRAGLV